LRFQRKHEGRIARNIDPLDRIHLNGYGEHLHSLSANGERSVVNGMRRTN
jgi:hypothetical protein